MPKYELKKDENKEPMEKKVDSTNNAYRQIGRSYTHAIIRKMLFWYMGDCDLFEEVVQNMPDVYNQGYEGWIQPNSETPFECMLVCAGKQFISGNFQYLGQLQTWVWQYVTTNYQSNLTEKDFEANQSSIRDSKKFNFKLSPENDQDQPENMKQQNGQKIPEQKEGKTSEKWQKPPTQVQMLDEINYSSEYNEVVDFYLRSVSSPKKQLDLFCKIMGVEPVKIRRNLSKKNEWVAIGTLAIEAKKFTSFELVFQAQASHSDNTVAIEKMALKILKTLYRRLPDQWMEFRKQKKGRRLLI